MRKEFIFEGEVYYMIESDNLKEDVDYVKKNKVKNICLHWYRGYDLDNVDLLLDIKDIEKLYVDLTKIKNTIPINSLIKARELYIFEKLPSILDLSFFPLLETLHVDWSKQVKNPRGLFNLKNLNIFNANIKSFIDLGKLPALEELTIFSRSIYSLEGIEGFKELRKLDINDASKLKSLDFNSSHHLKLKELHIINCKNIELESLEVNVNIKKLVFQNKSIESLDVIVNKFPYIEDLNFSGTVVQNGKISILKQIKSLKRIKYDDNKGYDIYCKDFFNKSSVPKNHSFIPLEKYSFLDSINNLNLRNEFASDLNAFVKSMSSLDGNQLIYVEEIVKKIDEKQLNHGHFIDSILREELVLFINDTAEDYGLHFEDDDLTWRWREEW